MSEELIDILTTLLMWGELYITLGALVGLVIRKEDHRFYPMPLWNTTPYVLLILFLWPVLLCAAPFWVARNRHRTVESVCEELYQLRREDTIKALRRQGLGFSADVIENYRDGADNVPKTNNKK